VYQFAKPGSITTNKNINYLTVVQYRESMLFWIKRVCVERDVAPHSKSELFN